MKIYYHKRLKLIILIIITVALTVSCNDFQGNVINNNERPAPSQKSIYKPLSVDVSGMDVASENNNNILLLDKKRMVIGIKNKKTGTVWLSCASDKDMNIIENKDVISDVLTQFKLQIFDQRGREQYLSSYKDSVQKNQYQLFSIKNGLRVEYTIGESEGVSIFPDAISRQLMDSEILPKLSESEKRRVLQFFTLFKYGETETDIREKLTSQYKNFKTTDIYISKTIGVRYKKEITQALKRIGFTSVILEKDYKAIGYDKVLERVPSFMLPVEYSIDNEGLNVNIKFGEAVYDEEYFKLLNISAMQFFGSSGKLEDGYMFFPDGTGAVIRLNSDKNIPETIKVYNAVDNPEQSSDYSIMKKSTALGVYGIKKSNDAFVAIIEEGDSLASITAMPSRNMTGLNNIGTSFLTLPNETMNATNLVLGHKIIKYAKDRYRGDYKIKYYLLDGDMADYIGMAKTVRKYIFGDAKIQEKTTSGNIVIDSYGVLNRKERILGIPYTKKRAYTTFMEAQTIISELKNKGVSDIAFRYVNAFQDETDNELKLDYNPASALGGKSQSDRFIEFTQENGVAYYPAYNIMYVRKDSIFDHFSKSRDAAVSLRDEIAYRYQGQTEEYSKKMMISPQSMTNYASTISTNLKKSNISNIAITDIGNDLYPNYNKKQFFLQDTSQKYIKQTLSAFSGLESIMIDGINLYTLKVADFFVDVPLSTSSYDIEDEEVPFLPIVIHGMVDYSPEALNLNNNYRESLLRTVEYGASLRYCLNYGDSWLLKETRYSNLFSTKYSVWLDEIAQEYAHYNEVFSKVRNSFIFSHEKINQFVYKTTYENNVSVYVNYGQDTYTDKAITVAAMDYTMIENEYTK